MPKTELIAPDNLIEIATHFDAIGRHAFQGCTKLNPVQSIVYETAYKSYKNMLVAAPTGSGKTNVAMMAVLHELKNYFRAGTTEMLSKDCSTNFKIIYIAPMKSLATEQTDNFNSRLKSLGIKTRELTGDMSLTEYEISQTHIIVTTPEKWDVVTRKSKGDINLLSLVRLLIIDEVHLLQSDRGPVLEALVARTLRYVESSQMMTRIIGLSATLPNYLDVANFLRVNLQDGLFYFDNRFRPVPLTQTFIGVRSYDQHSQAKAMDKLTYDRVLQYVQQSKQVMIFVHARNSTQRTAMKLREFIQLNNRNELFQPDLEAMPDAAKLVLNPRNKLLKDLFAFGFGIHHAGMIRQDRLLVEKLFRGGVLKVLVCTATLAWGVNFPAYAVIIRGTEMHDASAGKYVDIGLLDVMQIFGRAGRPQYDTDGEAIIMTGLDKLDMYLKLLTNQTPIESNFITHLTDNLNAEVVSGTISTIDEAIEWLSYTYLHVRLSQNPLAYGFEYYEILSDPSLTVVRRRLLTQSARQLDEARMCRFNPQTGQLEATDLGRIASHFYIKHQTVSRYNEMLKDFLLPQEILGIIGEAQEFSQMKYREEESNELDRLRQLCRLPISGGSVETTQGKVSALLQAHISRGRIESHSLISDLMYISQNAVRIARGLFEYSLKKGWPTSALNFLKMCKMLERQMWEFQTPYLQFDRELPAVVIEKLENAKYPVDYIDSISDSDVAKIVNFPDHMGKLIKDLTKQLPYIIIDAQIRPIKTSLLHLELKIQPYFKWNDKYHGRTNQSFWIWVTDSDVSDHIYFSEQVMITKEQVQKEQTIRLNINIPYIPPEVEKEDCSGPAYLVFASSNEWIGCDYMFPFEFANLKLPQDVVAYTKHLVDLDPLPISVFGDKRLEDFFCEGYQNQHAASSSKSNGRNIQSSFTSFNYFNSIQTQLFYPIYHGNKNMMVFAPPLSGKTTLAEIAMMRCFKKTQNNKVLYISPIESIATQMYELWHYKLSKYLRKKTFYLNEKNLYSHDIMNDVDVLIASARNIYMWLLQPETIKKLINFGLVILDDIHLIGDKRGATMELVIARLKAIPLANTAVNFRIFGLSTPVSSAQDIAAWISTRRISAYNFHPAHSRPIQLDVHLVGFPDRHYSPRMASMNKSIFESIMQYGSGGEPAIVYVSSKRQAKATAFDLISRLSLEPTNQKQWTQIPEADLVQLMDSIYDGDLKLLLEFGIGQLHTGMRELDKKIVQELFVYGKIQVLVATCNYAWDSQLRGRLIIIKGTEFYDAELQRHCQYPISDIIRMTGRAGRPHLDCVGVTVVMVQDVHKEYYRRLLYETFPVESSLLECDSMIVNNFLRTDQDDNNAENSAAFLSKCVENLSLTYYVRRLFKNPNYYQLNDTRYPEYIDRHISQLVENLLAKHQLQQKSE